MKKMIAVLLVSLLSATTNVNAEAWVMPNTGGGKITLTKEACPVDNYAYPTLRKAYTWTNSFYQEGCWYVIDGNVHIVWVNKDGSRDRRVYDINGFTQVR